MTPRDEIERCARALCEGVEELLKSSQATYLNPMGCIMLGQTARALRSALDSPSFTKVYADHLRAAIQPAAPATEDSDDTPKCEGCDSPATTQDSEGVPLCAPCCEDAIVPSPATEAKCGDEMWAIIYEDPSHPTESFVGSGAELAARARHEEANLSWNCHLMRSATPRAGASEGEGVADRNRRWEFEAVKRALDTGEEPAEIRGYHDKYLNEYAMTLRRVAAAARHEKAYLSTARPTPPPDETLGSEDARVAYEKWWANLVGERGAPLFGSLRDIAWWAWQAALLAAERAERGGKGAT